MTACPARPPAGPERAPGPALRDPRLEELRQHRLVPRPLPGLKGPAGGQHLRAAAPVRTPVPRPGAGGSGWAPEAGVGTAGPSVSVSFPGPAPQEPSPRPPTEPTPASAGPVPASTASIRGRALALRTLSLHRNAGPVTAPEHQQALLLARGASAAGEHRDPHVGAPARHLP